MTHENHTPIKFAELIGINADETTDVEKLKEYLTKIIASSKEKIGQKSIAAYEKLLINCAVLVWPLPPIDLMPNNIIEDLKDKNQEEVNIALTTHFLNKDKVGSMLAKHISETRLKNWKPMLEGACICFLNEQFTSCACSLFPVIEGLLCYFIEYGEMQTKSERKTKQKSEQLSEHFKDKEGIFAYEYISFLSIIKCIDSLFKSINDKDCQTFNRHLLLHGNLHRKIDKNECVKLYAIIDTLIRLKEFFLAMK